MSNIYVPTISECEESPVSFFKALGVYRSNYNCIIREPWAHQECILEKARDGKNIFISKPRQVGLSSSFTIYALWKAIFNPYSNIVFVTNKLDYHQFTQGQAIKAFEDSPIPYIKSMMGLFRILNDNRITFSNGSEILITSAFGAINDLRARKDVVICDEFDFFKNSSEIFNIINNIVIPNGGQFIIGSTPNSKSHSDIFKKNIMQKSSSIHESVRILYGYSRYKANSLNGRFPFDIYESGFFEGEEDIKNLIYGIDDWFPIEKFIEKENKDFHFFK